MYTGSACRCLRGEGHIRAMPELGCAFYQREPGSDDDGWQPLRLGNGPAMLTASAGREWFMNAWLLTWEGTEGAALTADEKIIAILSWRRSDQSVSDLVQVLYSRTVDSAGDMAHFANKRRLRENQYLHSHHRPGRFFYGVNPCIFARQVINLSIERDEARGRETLRWGEPPTYRHAKTGSGIEEDIAARDCEHVRSLVPLVSMKR
jgi:hypothetical protein